MLELRDVTVAFGDRTVLQRVGLTVGDREVVALQGPSGSGKSTLLRVVAGLLVAIPSMFGYNWLVHNLRVQTVELDNFAQALISQIETEYLKDE